MKRSEMIEKMADKMLELRGEFTIDHTCKSLLDLLESEGMLPPVIKDYENCHIEICSYMGEEIEDYYKWEPEDA